MVDLLSRTRTVRAEARRLVAALEPEAVPVGEVDAAAEALAEVERLAGAARLLLSSRLAEVDRTGTPDRDAAAFLARATGASVGAARSALRTGRRLGSLPRLRTAVRRGEVSAQRAAVVAEAAAVAPAEEARLVECARHESLRELRLLARGVVAAADPRTDEERAEAIHDERRAASWTAADGAGEGAFRGPVEQVAEIAAALDAHQERLFSQARAEGSRQPHAALRFDALLAMARASVRGGDAGKPLPKKLLVRADRAALARGAVAPGEVCDLPGHGPVPASVAADLARDGVWHALLTDGVDVRAVTNAQRKALVVQQVALEWSQPGCVVEGCPNTARLQIDHITGWTITHRTDLADLQRLCIHHHDLKTRFGFRYEPQPDGRRKEVRPPRAGRRGAAGAADGAGPASGRGDPPARSASSSGPPPGPHPDPVSADRHSVDPARPERAADPPVPLGSARSPGRHRSGAPAPG